MISYYLRRIDPAVWRLVKARAEREGRTVRFVLMELLKVYAKHGYAVVERFDHKEKG